MEQCPARGRQRKVTEPGERSWSPHLTEIAVGTAAAGFGTDRVLLDRIVSYHATLDPRTGLRALETALSARTAAA